MSNKSPIVVVPKYHKMGEGFSKQEKVRALEHPGRRTQSNGYQSPASWIADIVGCRQGVLLCSFCKVKFNAKRNKYRKRFIADPTGKTDGYTANGQCDGCKQETALVGGGTFFVAEEFYEQVCVDPAEARRRSRQAWLGYDTRSYYRVWSDWLKRVKAKKLDAWQRKQKIYSFSKENR